MREIIFRAKRLDNDDWVHGFLVVSPNNAFVSIGVWDEVLKDMFNLKHFTVDPSTVGQFTGLKDKNGKEIYEASSVKVFTDKLPIDYEEIPKEIVICQVVYECGGFHYMNDEYEFQIPCWQIDSKTVELL